MAQADLNILNFFNVTFDLKSGKHKSFRKPNDDPIYINTHSNHPPISAYHFYHVTTKHYKIMHLHTNMHSSTVGLSSNLNTRHILPMIKTRADTAT